eukprot:g1624.t1
MWSSSCSLGKPIRISADDAEELESRIQLKLAQLRRQREEAAAARESALMEQELQESIRHCRPVVMCGPSGAGKSTLIRKLMKKYPDTFGFSVSHTTRQPRKMEKEGVDYHFTDVESIQADIADGKFIESAEVHGNIYGTSKAAVLDVAKKKQVCILDIDVQGVHSVQQSPDCSDFLYVFVRPPSIAVLSERLHGRGTESLSKIRRRVSNAAREMLAAERMDFDTVIVNDNLEVAFDQLDQFIGPNRCACMKYRQE